MTAKNTSNSNTLPSADISLSIRLSRNISARRRLLGLTQAQLAERLGVDTETLSRFERGKHLPSLVTLERLAGLLLTTVAELLDEQLKMADDDALIVSSWLAGLSLEDRQFACGILKLCCDYLEQRHSTSPSTFIDQSNNDQ